MTGSSIRVAPNLPQGAEGDASCVRLRMLTQDTNPPSDIVRLASGLGSKTYTRTCLTRPEPMEKFDAIVVGAGPAGSAAADGLPEAGRQTPLLQPRNAP